MLVVTFLKLSGLILKMLYLVHNSVANISRQLYEALMLA